MKSQQYIAVTGTMGSGKTTAAKLIAHHFGFHLLEEQFGENAFLPRFYNDMPRWAFHSQTFFLLEKISQMNHTQELIKKTSVVQDTSILQDVFSYAKAQRTLGNMDEAEWGLYRKIYRSFEPNLPIPSVLLFLDTSVPILMDRIESRGRGYEQKIPQRYVELLDQLNRRWIASEQKTKVVTIKTDTLNIVRSKQAQHEFIEKVTKALENEK